ncbi:MAG: hypothetical protein LIQ30_03270 [Planctomycetes bacterium]|nr:hypothetical protein [Planctomycetota bacterium]
MDGKDILRTQMAAKNGWLAALFTILFGGFGLFYVSFLGGIVASLIELVLLLISFITGGLASFLLVPWHIFCIIVAVVMVSSHNNRLLRELDRSLVKNGER